MKKNLKTLLFLLACSLFSTNAIQAQTILNHEDSIALNKFRNLPNIEVGRGISFMPKDSSYRLNIRFRMQNIAAVTFNDNDDVTSELRAKRLRLRFEGFAFSPKLSYVIQLGFTGYDNDGLSGTANMVRDAIIYYIPNNHWSFGFGQTKVPGNRARVNSSSALQFVDRSLTNSTFNLDRDFGFFATYNNNLNKEFDYIIKTAITSGEGRNYKSAPNAGFAYTGRVELFPLGRFKKLGDLIEGDYEREGTPKFMLAGAYSSNHKAIRLSGQRGSVLENEATRTINAMFVDFIFKYNGFAFYTDYMARYCSDPVIVKSDEEQAGQYILKGNGINLQTSYIFKNNWEVAARFSTVNPAESVKSYAGYDQNRQYTLGITKYVIGHSLKLQLDATYDQKDMIVGNNQSFWMTRFQIELGI
ncbi:MAG: porin [Breznakibacter sp.]